VASVFRLAEEPRCPLSAGRYTSTQIDGGTLRVATLSAFPFPSGGTLIQDVGPADVDCVHDTVVEFPGGFDSPTFCIPALGFSVSVAQSGCGVGRIDSDGGADFTVREIGDTSDASSTCNLGQVCTNGVDSSVRVDVTVGDGNPDACASGTGNAVVAIPVHTQTWLENAGPGECPAIDGTYNPEAGDALVTEFDQTLDLTTDSTATQWMDIDGDGCALAGVGPAGGFPVATGVCLDLDAGTVRSVASGPVASIGTPLFDITFLTDLPNSFTRTGEPTNATCDMPPAINFAGQQTRCF
jgi:hypothetical protein